MSVISAYSLPRINEVIEWTHEKYIQKFIYLQTPDYLYVDMLSQEGLNKAIQNLSPYKLLFMPWLKNIKPRDNKKFKEFTSALDQIRNQDYKSILK